jgi:YjjG family noncanonical pyrimidine nucleotidase
MKYNWLLFDADGTLFDYDRTEWAALQDTFESLGLPYQARYASVYRQINADIWLDFEKGRITQERLRTKRFELLFDAVQIACDPEVFSPKYLTSLASYADLVDGAEEVLRELHGQAGLLLITNGLSDVQRSRFARSTVMQYFADVVISEEVGAAKPGPEIFDVAFAKMGHPKREEVLMIGDSLTSDIKGGNLYGIDTCWFNPGRRQRDSDVRVRYEISELEELLDILGDGHGSGGLRPGEVNIR